MKNYTKPVVTENETTKFEPVYAASGSEAGGYCMAGKGKKHKTPSCYSNKHGASEMCPYFSSCTLSWEGNPGGGNPHHRP